MEYRLTATELARRVGDILSRIRYRGDAYVIERSGVPVARMVPLAERPAATLRDVAVAWREVGAEDPCFADDLERVGAADRPPASPWGS